MSQNAFSPPVVQSPVLDQSGNTFARPWYEWLASTVANALQAPVSASAPANSSAQGTPGQVAFDQNFLYIFTGNAWKRIPLTSF